MTIEFKRSTDTSFVMVDSDQEISKAIYSRIGQINDINLRVVQQNELSRLYDLFDTGQRIRTDSEIQLYEKYLGPLPKDIKSRNFLEQTFCQHYEQLTNEHQYKSYGVSAPSYFTELLNYREKHSPEYPCQSLLIGAATINSVQEYLAVNHSVFRKSKNTVIDIDTHHLLGSPDCIQMNAFEMSFADESFDTIQTNYLIGNLIHSMSSNQTISQLWPEKSKYYTLLTNGILKALKHGGQLIMVERKDIDSITNFMFKAGFKEIRMEQTSEFQNLTDVTKLTRCSHGNFNLLKKSEKIYLTSSSTIIATKN